MSIIISRNEPGEAALNTVIGTESDWGLKQEVNKSEKEGCLCIAKGRMREKIESGLTQKQDTWGINDKKRLAGMARGVLGEYVIARYFNVLLDIRILGIHGDKNRFDLTLPDGSTASVKTFTMLGGHYIVHHRDPILTADWAILCYYNYRKYPQCVWIKGFISKEKFNFPGTKFEKHYNNEVMEWGIMPENFYPIEQLKQLTARV